MRRAQEPRRAEAVVVEAVKRMRRKTKAGRMSLRAIAAELAAQGHVNERGAAYNPKSVAAMLAA